MRKINNSNIFYKVKKWFGLRFKKKMYKLKEPILEVIRRNGKIDIFEGVKAGEYKILHSNGDERFVNLNPSKLLYRYDEETGDSIKTWIIHEDEIEPYPQNPYVDSELVYNFIDKVKSSVKDYELSKIKASNERIMTIAKAIGIIIAIVIGMDILMVLFTGKDFLFHIGRETAINTAKELINNSNGLSGVVVYE